MKMKLSQDPSSEDIIDYSSYIYRKRIHNYHLNNYERHHIQCLYKQIKNQLLPCLEKNNNGKNIDGIVFTFHALLKKKDQVLNITSIENYDMHRDDFPEMIGLHYAKSVQTNPNYLWILITNNGFQPKVDGFKLGSKVIDPCIINCELNTSELMFERVCAAFALTQLLGKRYNIVYLDGDAFPMHSFEPVWNIKKDVFLTKRRQLRRSVFPINEGVFFGKRGNNLLNFFNAYIKTYSLLSTDNNLKGYYTNSIKRWRGGQLSLNVISALYDELALNNMFSLEYLNCRTFNCFTKNYKPIDISKKYILHVKGRDKSFDDIKNTLNEN